MWTFLASGPFVILMYCFHFAHGRSACYLSLGCFYPRNGWVGRWETLPDSPADIQTIFTLYTKNESGIMLATEREGFNVSTFDPEFRTVVLLKGDPDFNPDNWADMKLEELRENSDVNILLVDWNVRGADSYLYDTTLSNLRVVGAQIGLVLDDLRRVHDIDLETIEFLGHSLRGHVSIYSWADIVDAKTINGYDPKVYRADDDMIKDIPIVDIIQPGSPYGVCYDLLGCFLQRYTGELLPERPESLKTKFKFYLPNGKEHWLNAVDIQLAGFIFTGVQFDKDLETKIIIHGFMEDSEDESTWTEPLVDELRKQEQYNIIVVDWKEGADSLIFAASVANTRVVGVEIALLIKKLIQLFEADPATIHIIGYSLGAHVAGYAGANIWGIGRITGLDPAGWWFEAAHSFSSLDPTDALFVDIIHTDSGPPVGFGIRRPIGTVDFYVNGGQDQPGCPKGSFLGRAIRVLNGHTVCSHKRSIELFTESININRCHFVGHPCEDIDNYDKCVTCDGGCAQMGFHSDIANVSIRSYHVTTLSQKPYCSISEAKEEGLIPQSINNIPVKA